ncbi:hypothetical protein [Argonema antarcticum]|uniref:hypothetical protein n=1 Tax=Argonema antarcticum TaxID=2942763 RepID=UPI002011FE73|nr:hypothetical protein [Argonema antarcticum]MCL1472138.1 hypothetical protein [Argonema antarcticum A004/B2]
MNNEKKIPDAETRAKSIARWREVNLMWDELNMMLDQAIAQAEMDLQNSPLYASRRRRVEKQLEALKKQNLEVENKEL